MLTVTFWVFTGILRIFAPGVPITVPPTTVPSNPLNAVFVFHVLIPLKSLELTLSAGKSTVYVNVFFSPGANDL